ncbi:MAG: hypothetical protein LC715_01015 [Gammaproteobacteria bacterium]|nr:hypothetical protein [Gammaproteobacteria bacterium]
MIRKLFLPALAAMLLAGCMSYGYDYRGGRSDYYYGQPSAEYRYYGSGSGYGYGGPYGSIGYGHPGGFYGSIGYGSPYGYSRYSRYGHYPRGYYGYPYGFYNGYGYGYPYDPYYYYRRPIVVQPRPDGTTQPPRVERPDDDATPPWRNLDEVARRRIRDPEPAPRSVAPPSGEVRARVGRGEIIRERRLEAPEREERLEQTP